MPVPTLTLVSHHLCPYVQRAAIVLAEKSAAHERLTVDLAAKPEWFKRLSPLGKVPLLLVGDTALFESAVICEYLDETLAPRLHPEAPLERASHRAWIEFGSAILNDIARLYNAETAAAFQQRRELRGKLEWLERHLGKGPYFAGERFHVVDAVYGPIFRYFDTFEAVGIESFFAGLPNVSAWRAALSARPSVQAAVAPDYPERLRHFLATRRSHLATLATQPAPAG
jgi:glutathione S-transferase